MAHEIAAALASGGLSFLGAAAGTVGTLAFSRRKHVDDLIDKAIERVHGANDALAGVAYNQLEDMVMYDRLNDSQKRRILTSAHAYLARPKGGSVDSSPATGG